MKRYLIIGGVLVAGAAVLLWIEFTSRGRLMTPAPSSTPSLPSGKAETLYSPDELLEAIRAGRIDPEADKATIAAVFELMPPDVQAAWMKQLAELLGGLDPSAASALQRAMGHFALSRGYAEDGWVVLAPVMGCEACSRIERDDALRLLDQFTLPNGSHRAELTAAVLSRAREVLAADTPETGPLPLVWSAFRLLATSGHAGESIAMRRRYLERYEGVISAEAFANSQQTFAQELIANGNAAEARPLLLEIAERYRGTAMSENRAIFVAHAARASSTAEAVTLLEGVLADSTELHTASTATVYYQLQLAYKAAGNNAEALQAVERYWSDRGSNGSGLAAVPGGADANHNANVAAALCADAATLARQLNRPSDAELWYRRVLEVGPNTLTAATVREMLARRQ